MMMKERDDDSERDDDRERDDGMMIERDDDDREG